MSIKKTSKRFILKVTPDKILRKFKKYHYASYLRHVSENEEIEFKIVRYLVKPGDHVLDIGANIGVYTKYLSSLVGTDGRVYSFEPIPSTFEFLTYNIEKLALKNVELFNCAVSNADGWGTMEIPLYPTGGDNFYQARIVPEHNPGSQLRQISVGLRTIDSLVSSFPNYISFIKCDVEGHELNCIKGAVDIIGRVKPAWLIEVSGNPDNPESSACEITQKMSNEGYEVYWFDGARLKKRYKGDKSINYFFLTKKHVAELKKKQLIS